MDHWTLQLPSLASLRPRVRKYGPSSLVERVQLQRVIAPGNVAQTNPDRGYLVVARD